MGTSVVPSATDDNPHFPYIRTAEEFGGLVAYPWYPIVEFLHHQTNARIFFLHKRLCIPINVLTTVTTTFFYPDVIESRERGLQLCGHASYRRI
jgi:hypothetical protein